MPPRSRASKRGPKRPAYIDASLADLELVRVEDVQVDPNNPRIHDDRNLDAIAESISRYGLQTPIVIDASGTLRKGHGTLAAMRRLGYELVAVVRSSLDGTIARAYGVADNRTSDLSAFDPDRLQAEVNAILADKGTPLELATMGFTTGEYLSLLNAEDSFVPKTPTNDPDAIVPPDETGDPITKPGEVIEVGHHRILCGDCTDAASFEKLLAGEEARMLWTDPPWNVAIGQDNNPRHRRRAGLENDDMDADKFNEFLARFVNCGPPRVTGDIYIVLGWPGISELDRILRSAGYHWSATIEWVKSSFALGRGNYHRRHEPIWYGWKTRSSFNGDRNLDDVWEVRRPSRSADHPTMKPVALVEKAILNSSKPGDAVIDCFLGGGSALVACEMTQRRCMGIEISPRFCDSIVRRYIDTFGADSVSKSLAKRYARTTPRPKRKAKTKRRT